MPQVKAAVKALIIKNHKFLILKQAVINEFFWDLPGGKIEYNEPPFDTLLREVKEETNLDIKIIKPLGIWWFIHKGNNNQVICTTFVCQPLNKDVNISNNPVNENIVEFKWVTKEEFLKNNYPTGHNSLKKLIATL
jgi:8-oxo-dGTP diphosphatase